MAKSLVDEIAAKAMQSFAPNIVALRVAEVLQGRRLTHKAIVRIVEKIMRETPQ